jgi:hypothetical protein
MGRGDRPAIEQTHLAVGIVPIRNAEAAGASTSRSTGDGVLAVAEAGYRWNQANDATGLPGSATFGGYFDSSEFEALDGSGETSDGNHGFYLLVDQTVYREDQGRAQGLTPWAALTLAPDEKINTIPFSAAGGLAGDQIVLQIVEVAGQRLQETEQVEIEAAQQQRHQEIRHGHAADGTAGSQHGIRRKRS